jgi:hypothetical protein
VLDVLGVADARTDALPADGSFDEFDGNATTPRALDAAAAYEIVANEVAIAATEEAVVRCPDATCIGVYVQQVGARLYRRVLDATEVDEYRSLYDDVAASEGHADAIAAILAALLQSPIFLYRVELGVGAPAAGPRALTREEIAGRLASFLWRSVPDVTLLEEAASGRLDTEEGRTGVVARMMADARFDRALASFHESWLSSAHAAPTPGVSPELEADMHEELARYVRAIVRSPDPSVAHLFTEASTELSTRLAEHYGAPAPSTEWAAVRLPERAGLLGRALPIVTNSGAATTRSIHRGLLVFRRVLCRAIGAPIAAAATRQSTFARDPSWTDRQYVTHLTMDDPTCASCHASFGPLGFAFEDFDTEGRLVGGGDATGELDGVPFDGLVDLENALVRAEVEDCLARRWLGFALGRAASDGEVADLASRTADLRAGGAALDLAALVARIPHTQTFGSIRSR